MKLIKCLLLVTILINFANAELFVYVTDKIDIPIRYDPKFGDNIIDSVPSGSRLAVLQVTKDGWSKVVFKNTTGWIVSRYLSDEPSAIEQLEKLKQKNDADKILINEHKQKNTKLLNKINQLIDNNAKLFAQNNKLQAEKKHIEQTYKNALKLENANAELILQISQLETKNKLLADNNINEQAITSRNWFITGAIILFLGAIIGFFASKKRKRY